ncbi:MAG: hypothetical protein U0838_15070 [Chloroflexota bacterium]
MNVSGMVAQTRQRRLLAVSLAGLLVVSVAGAAQAAFVYSNSTKMYACVNNSTKAARIVKPVSGRAACRSGESLVSWAKNGAQVQGLRRHRRATRRPGATGATGAQGEQGATGATGAQGEPGCARAPPGRRACRAIRGTGCAGRAGCHGRHRAPGRSGRGRRPGPAG